MALAPAGSFSMDANADAVGSVSELSEENRTWAKISAVLGTSDSILREAVDAVRETLGDESAAAFENIITSTRIHRANAAIQALRALGLEYDPEAKKRSGPFGAAYNGPAESRRKEEE